MKRAWLVESVSKSGHFCVQAVFDTEELARAYAQRAMADPRNQSSFDRFAIWSPGYINPEPNKEHSLLGTSYAEHDRHTISMGS